MNTFTEFLDFVHNEDPALIECILDAYGVIFESYTKVSSVVSNIIKTSLIPQIKKNYKNVVDFDYNGKEYSKISIPFNIGKNLVAELIIYPSSYVKLLNINNYTATLDGKIIIADDYIYGDMLGGDGTKFFTESKYEEILMHEVTHLVDYQNKGILKTANMLAKNYSTGTVSNVDNKAFKKYLNNPFEPIAMMVGLVNKYINIISNEATKAKTKLDVNSLLSSSILQHIKTNDSNIYDNFNEINRKKLLKYIYAQSVEYIKNGAINSTIQP